MVSSPRPWGCFQRRRLLQGRYDVFPTPVGVFPVMLKRLSIDRRLPHARGGVSCYADFATASAQSSPRPWGCFCRASRCRRTTPVFPTPVGVFPRRPTPPTRGNRLPHARGGVSLVNDHSSLIFASSPRPWGCFSFPAGQLQAVAVFPTPVGVFLVWTRFVAMCVRLPHARGGVSIRAMPAIFIIPSSPRPWGCFSQSSSSSFDVEVFPTPVGVFL